MQQLGYPSLSDRSAEAVQLVDDAVRQRSEGAQATMLRYQLYRGHLRTCGPCSHLKPSGNWQLPLTAPRYFSQPTAHCRDAAEVFQAPDRAR